MKDFSVVATITDEEVDQIVESLDTFQHKIGRKKLNIGGLGELMVSSILGLSILSGQTTRGPDAVLLKDTHKLRRGRYQIKYRNWDTSDIVFRIDVDKEGKSLEKYSWDYLLIATHERSIAPNRFFCLPVKEVIRMSEILIEKNNIVDLVPNSSKNKSTNYFLFRLNWTWDRNNNIGCTGRKREKILERYEVISSTKRHPVNIIEYSGST